MTSTPTSTSTFIRRDQRSKRRCQSETGARWIPENNCLWPLQFIEAEGVPFSYVVAGKMKLNKDKTSLRVNDSLTLEGICCATGSLPGQRKRCPKKRMGSAILFAALL